MRIALQRSGKLVLFTHTFLSSIRDITWGYQTSNSSGSEPQKAYTMFQICHSPNPCKQTLMRQIGGQKSSFLKVETLIQECVPLEILLAVVVNCIVEHISFHCWKRHALYFYSNHCVTSASLTQPASLTIIIFVVTNGCHFLFIMWKGLLVVKRSIERFSSLRSFLWFLQQQRLQLLSLKWILFSASVFLWLFLTSCVMLCYCGTCPWKIDVELHGIFWLDK